MRHRYAWLAVFTAVAGTAGLLALFWKPRSQGPLAHTGHGAVSVVATNPSIPIVDAARSPELAPPPPGEAPAVGDPSKAPPNPLRDGLSSVLSLLAGEKDPARHRDILDALVGKISSAELGLALAALTDPAFEKSGRELRQRLFERWGGENATQAAAWAERMSPGEGRSEAFGDIARGWASKDANAAKAWALGLGETSDRDAALLQTGYVLARERPVEALEVAIEMEATRARDQLVHLAAAQWASRAPAEAVEWANQVPDESLRLGLMRDIFTAWGDADASAAATAAVKSMPEGRSRDDTVVGIVQRWAQKEPEIAAAWVSAFPGGELRETAGRELVTIWAEQSAEEAGRWLNGLPVGDFRDTAVDAYVGKILPMAPETAAVWAAEIAEPGRRAEMLERVGESWLESDAAAARAWISASPLSPETKARLLAPREASPAAVVPGVPGAVVEPKP